MLLTWSQSARHCTQQSTNPLQCVGRRRKIQTFFQLGWRCARFERNDKCQPLAFLPHRFSSSQFEEQSLLFFWVQGGAPAGEKKSKNAAKDRPEKNGVNRNKFCFLPNGQPSAQKVSVRAKMESRQSGYSWKLQDKHAWTECLLRLHFSSSNAIRWAVLLKCNCCRKRIYARQAWMTEKCHRNTSLCFPSFWQKAD